MKKLFVLLLLVNACTQPVAKTLYPEKQTYPAVECTVPIKIKVATDYTTQRNHAFLTQCLIETGELCVILKEVDNSTLYCNFKNTTKAVPD